MSPLEGAYNFRDLGRLTMPGGRRVRPGLLFRSDTLQALTAMTGHHSVDALSIWA